MLCSVCVARDAVPLPLPPLCPQVCLGGVEEGAAGEEGGAPHGPHSTAPPGTQTAETGR